MRRLSTLAAAAACALATACAGLLDLEGLQKSDCATCGLDAATSATPHDGAPPGVKPDGGCGACSQSHRCGADGLCAACESDAALCARLGRNCGAVSATDDCGSPRTVDCGACMAPQRCGGGPLANVCDTRSGATELPGSVTNASVAPSVSGAMSAYGFDGVGQSITVPSSALSNPGPAMTLSFWARSADWRACARQTLVSRGPDSGYWVGCDEAGALKARVRRGGAFGEVAFDAGALENGTLHLFVLTYDGTSTKLYVDGSPVGSTNAASPHDIEYGPFPLVLGAEPSPQSPPVTGRYFNGQIEQIRIYPFALSEKRIGDLRVLSTAYAHWRLNDGAGTRASNCAPTEDGAVKGAAWAPASPRGGLVFNGQSDYVTASDGPFDFTGAFTITAWVNPTMRSSDWMNVVAKTESSGYLLAIYRNDFRFGADLGRGYEYAATRVPELGRWYHLVGTYDLRSLTLYVDGELKDSLAVAGVLTRNDEPLTIGADPDDFGTRFRELFAGSLAEVQIYKRALTSAEAQLIYHE